MIHIKYRVLVFCLSKTPKNEFSAGNNEFVERDIMPFRANMAGVFWSHQLKSSHGMNTD